MAPPKPSLAGKHCLVLDDEFLIALDIQQILESAGAADVSCFSKTDEALAAIASGAKFDLAVLDVKLGDDADTSLALAAALTEQGTPFVFLTGMRAADGPVSKFPEAPVVEKPYQVPALMDALRKALEMS
jgi:DNA-binding NtrC family response regulator